MNKYLVATWAAGAFIFLGIPLIVVGPAKLMEAGKPAVATVPVIPAAAHVAPVVPKYSPQERARWACSDAIEARAYVPGSIKWTRRSQWLAQEVSPGVWEVHAHFMAQNRMGVDIVNTAACRVRQVGDTFTVIGG